jgi:tripartite ATP-independent transporter DctP family solute receptor
MRGALLAVAIATSGSTAHGKELRSSDISPLDSPTVQAVVYMDGLVRQRTEGRHSIGMLGQEDADSENFTIGQVRNGTLDMARVNLAVFNATVPSTVVPSLPYLFKSTDHMRRVLDGPIGEKILADLEDQGLIGLCFYDGGARSFYSTKKPIQRAADIKGMKVRIQQGDSAAAMVRALGATPMPMSHQQGYVALQAGVVDAAINSMQFYSTSRHFQVAKYFSVTEHSMAPGVLVFSKQVWDTLSKNDQEAIRSSAKDSVQHMRKLWDASEASARSHAVAGGAHIVTDVDGKSFAEALLPLHPVLVTSPRLRSMVAEIEARADVVPQQ